MPRSSQIHQNRPLENISVAYTTPDLIAEQLSPMVPVKNESDTYYVYEKDTLSIPQTIRADGAKANQATFNLSTATYTLEEHALKDLVTDRQRGNADKAISPDIDATEDLTRKIRLRKELDLANLVTTAANWGTTLSLTSTFAWSANTTLSNPITQIDSLASAILYASGLEPNIIAVDDPSFRAAKEHVSILDRIKYTSPDSVTPQMLAKLWNVDMVLVGKAVQNTANEGITPSLTAIWTDMAFLAYVERSPGLRKPSALYTFTQKIGNPVRVKKWREEERGGDWIEVSQMFQNVAVASDCAGLIVNTIQ